MAQALVIEEEAGTCRGWVHTHNGYYAGDFSTAREIGPDRGAGAPRRLRVVVDSPAGISKNTSAVPARWPEAA